MAKYNYHDLRKRGKSVPLPLDINEDAEGFCKRVEDEIALNYLKEAKEKHFFQSVFVSNKAGRIIAEIIVSWGIVPNYKLHKYRSATGELAYIRNVLNEKVEMRNRRQGDQ